MSTNLTSPRGWGTLTLVDYLLFAIFSAHYVFGLLPTHGRSHRFKSCVANNFIIIKLHNNASQQNRHCAQIRAGKIVHDRLQIPIGQVRIDFRGSPGLVSKENQDSSEIPDLWLNLTPDDTPIYHLRGRDGAKLVLKNSFDQHNRIANSYQTPIEV